MKKILFCVFLLMTTPLLANDWWTNWQLISHKGVTACGRNEASNAIFNRCKSQLKSGQRLLKTEMSQFADEYWNDGFMRRERNCLYNAYGRCHITNEAAPVFIHGVLVKTPYACFPKNLINGGQMTTPAVYHKNFICFRTLNHSSYKLYRKANGTYYIKAAWYGGDTSTDHSYTWHADGHINALYRPNRLGVDSNHLPKVNRASATVIWWKKR